MKSVVVGVLALQGAFAKHMQMLRQLGVRAIEVRKPEELAACDALIIPGGESTTMLKQMEFIDFFAAFRHFSQHKPVFGTCAGLILMSHDVVGDTMRPFDLLDIGVERNAFGRQAESFQADIAVTLGPGKPSVFPAVFIRAPRIRRVGGDVQVLASHAEEPVLVQQGRHLAATFHPELTSDTTIHAHFLKLLKG